MMNISPAEARDLSLWEYEALLYNWNKIHDPDHVEIVDPEITQRKIDGLKARPDLLK